MCHPVVVKLDTTNTAVLRPNSISVAKSQAKAGVILGRVEQGRKQLLLIFWLFFHVGKPFLEHDG